MSPELEALIERTRDRAMTAHEDAAQRLSFAYGNTHFENERITKETVRREAEILGGFDKKDRPAEG